MYDVEDLVSRLTNGETEDDIASEMTNNLNKAIQEVKKREEEWNAQMAALKTKVARRTNAARECAKQLIAAIAQYYEDIDEKEMSASLLNTSDEEINKIADALESITSLTKFIHSFIPTDDTSKKSYNNNYKHDYDDNIQNIKDNKPPRKDKDNSNWVTKTIEDFLSTLN